MDLIGRYDLNQELDEAIFQVACKVYDFGHHLTGEVVEILGHHDVGQVLVDAGCCGLHIPNEIQHRATGNCLHGICGNAFAHSVRLGHDLRVLGLGGVH